MYEYSSAKDCGQGMNIHNKISVNPVIIKHCPFHGGRGGVCCQCNQPSMRWQIDPQGMVLFQRFVTHKWLLPDKMLGV